VHSGASTRVVGGASPFFDVGAYGFELPCRRCDATRASERVVQVGKDDANAREGADEEGEPAAHAVQLYQ